MSGLLELAERCEKAEGPDRELDRAIAPIIGIRVVDEGHPLGWCYYDENGHGVPLPLFTASIDAAMTLVPKSDGETAVFWKVGNDGEGADPALFKATILIVGPFTSETFTALSDTAALALCPAALRARAGV